MPGDIRSCVAQGFWTTSGITQTTAQPGPGFPPGGVVCASQQDTGEQPQPPESPEPRALSPSSSRTPRRSYILLNFRTPPRRRQRDEESLPGKDRLPDSELLLDGEPLPDGAPLPDSKPLSASEPPSESQPLSAREPLSVGKPPPDSKPLSAGEPLSVGQHLPDSETLPDSDSPPCDHPPQELAQAQASANSSASTYATRLLDGSLAVIGTALFLCALATLTSTWAWSWHAGSGVTFTLSRMHGVCTSAMGELAQGASGNVATHCLWVDGTWTEAVALTGGGCILAAIGVARIVRAVRTPT
jgi:hypothetical protein